MVTYALGMSPIIYQFLGRSEPDTNPPSSLSSPFCGQRICLSHIALVIIKKTNIHAPTRIPAITVPMICNAFDVNALPIASVAVTKAVFGKIKLYHVMLKRRRP